ncbi:hypothetical protein [Salinimicrobium flavum]|uniref:Uncharacterized protein n=1 Tax=Salinimicrobium flavum TaxID=1737065 RepID=A0ABW5ITJ8_9FLAO
MIYLLWSLLNVLVILYFVFLLIGFIAIGRKIFGRKLRLVSVSIMVLGLVNIIAAAGPEENNPETFVTDVYGQNETEYKRILLEDNLSLDIDLTVTYLIENGELIPVQKRSILTGFLPGFEWDLISVSTSEIKEDGQVDYAAEGVLKWNLFGINIYSQAKWFRGRLL